MRQAATATFVMLANVLMLLACNALTGIADQGFGENVDAVPENHLGDTNDLPTDSNGADASDAHTPSDSASSDRPSETSSAETSSAETSSADVSDVPASGCVGSDVTWSASTALQEIYYDVVFGYDLVHPKLRIQSVRVFVESKSKTLSWELNLYLGTPKKTADRKTPWATASAMSTSDAGVLPITFDFPSLTTLPAGTTQVWFTLTPVLTAGSPHFYAQGAGTPPAKLTRYEKCGAGDVDYCPSTKQLPALTVSADWCAD